MKQSSSEAISSEACSCVHAGVHIESQNRLTKYAVEVIRHLADVHGFKAAVSKCHTPEDVAVELDHPHGRVILNVEA